MAGVYDPPACRRWRVLASLLMLLWTAAWLLAVASSWWWLLAIPVWGSGLVALNYLRASCP